VRVLANELFASKIGIALCLPIPEPQVIDISEEFIRRTALHIEIEGHRIPCMSGSHVGSRYIAQLEGTVFEYLPESLFPRVSNREDFIRVLAFDKWLGNCDGRQVVFTKHTLSANPIKPVD
jgi:hypothetical protein